MHQVYDGLIDPSNLFLEYGYDYSGNRFAKAEYNGSNFEQTNFLIDNNNLTGYSQTLLELDYETGNINRVYEYGDDLTTQISNPFSPTLVVSNFLYDGLGSTRALTDTNASISSSFNYQPFGAGIGIANSPLTNHLFTGEYFDNDLNLYHLRARYYDPYPRPFYFL